MPAYNRLTVNFKVGIKDHERAWEVLSHYDNKTACVVEALIMLDDVKNKGKKVFSESDLIRQIVREELAKALAEVKMTVKPGDSEEVKQIADKPEEKTKDKQAVIGKDVSAQILSGLSAFRK
jgi:hypothetical protein